MAWVCCVGCVQADLEQPAEPPALDRAFFRCEVEPVLVARCGFSACHGSVLRPFRVYAPNRLRATGHSGSSLTDAERDANFASARAFGDDMHGAPLLQLKGLAVSAGGYFHRGAEMFGGGDSFESIDDPGYNAIVRWTRDRETASADCEPRQEVGP